MKNDKDAHIEVGFTGLLTVVFIALKLCNVINWSWWWVLSPAWLGVLGCIAFLLLSVLLNFISVKLEEKEEDDDGSR